MCTTLNVLTYIKLMEGCRGFICYFWGKKKEKLLAALFFAKNILVYFLKTTAYFPPDPSIPGTILNL